MGGGCSRMKGAVVVLLLCFSGFAYGDGSFCNGVGTCDARSTVGGYYAIASGTPGCYTGQCWECCKACPTGTYCMKSDPHYTYNACPAVRLRSIGLLSPPPYFITCPPPSPPAGTLQSKHGQLVDFCVPLLSLCALTSPPFPPRPTSADKLNVFARVSSGYGEWRGCFRMWNFLPCWNFYSRFNMRALSPGHLQPSRRVVLL